jgi:uncharacterized protein YukE
VAEKFGVTPSELRAVAGELGECSSRIKAKIAALRAQIAGEGAGIACALTAGDAATFHSQCDYVQSTVDPANTGVVDYWAAVLRLTADASQRSDQER